MIWAILILPLVIGVMDWALWSRISRASPFPSARWRWRRRRRMPWVATWVWCVVATKFLAPSSQPNWQAWTVCGAGVAILAWWVAAIYADLKE